jgi:divalent metal cation (Fe/Co/Zn/Cd) transporter
MTSLVALVAIAAGQFYPFLDPVGGCLVSLLIIKAGFQSGKSACQEIVDRGLEPEILSSVRVGAQNGVMQASKTLGSNVAVVVGDVNGTKSGTYYIVDVQVQGSRDMTVEMFERVKEEVVQGVKADNKNVKIVRVFITSNGDKPETVS